MMIAFLLVGSLLIAGWSVMFCSMIYRFTFVDWPFFGSVTVASFVFMILSMVFGLACRTNFGKGLMDYRTPRPPRSAHQTFALTLEPFVVSSRCQRAYGPRERRAGRVRAPVFEEVDERR